MRHEFNDQCRQLVGKSHRAVPLEMASIEVGAVHPNACFAMEKPTVELLFAGAAAYEGECDVMRATFERTHHLLLEW